MSMVSPASSASSAWSALALGAAFIALSGIDSPSGALVAGALAKEDEARPEGAESLSLSPWYCPPPGEVEASCVRQYRFSKASPYIEETLVPNSARVLATIGSELEEDLGLNSATLIAASQALLTLIEAVRLLMCVARFHVCIQPAGTAEQMFDEVCGVIALQQQLLRPFTTGLEEFGDDDVCWALFVHGQYFPLMRAIAQPLHGLTMAALPWMNLPNPTNYGTRFFYEQFFEARSLRLRGRRSNRTMAATARAATAATATAATAATGVVAPAGDALEKARRTAPTRSLDSVAVPGSSAPRLVALQRLEYPTIFSPNAVCHGRSQAAQSRRKGNQALFVGDVQQALQRLTRHGVPLSNFVVNFGTADGECGSYEDWNADPANCLLAQGAAGLLVEGNPKFREALMRRFGARKDVVLFLEYLSLSNVSSILQWHIDQTPTFSFSPDLLKVDLDHSDCLFAEEALSTIHPKLLHLEYANSIPPPMEYVQHYQDDLLSLSLLDRRLPLLAGEESDEAGTSTAKERSKQGLELTGCSLSAFLTRLPGYSLVAAGPEDLLMVRKDLQAALEIGPPPDPWESWLDGAFCHPLHLYHAGYVLWGFDYRYLADERVDRLQRQALLTDLLRQHGSTAFSLATID